MGSSGLYNIKQGNQLCEGKPGEQCNQQLVIKLGKKKAEVVKSESQNNFIKEH